MQKKWVFGCEFDEIRSHVDKRRISFLLAIEPIRAIYKDPF